MVNIEFETPIIPNYFRVKDMNAVIQAGKLDNCDIDSIVALFRQGLEKKVSRYKTRQKELLREGKFVR